MLQSVHTVFGEGGQWLIDQFGNDLLVCVGKVEWSGALGCTTGDGGVWWVVAFGQKDHRRVVEVDWRCLAIEDGVVN